MNLRLPLLTLALCLAAANSDAQTSLETASALFVRLCPGLVSKLTEEEAFAEATKSQPVSTDAVCSCAGTRIVADARLQSYFNVDETTLKRRLQTESARSYLALRAVESMLSCLVPELERSLSALDLPQ
jgi:hypothetical protein